MQLAASISHALSTVLEPCREQLLAFFLSPRSTFSLAALTVTLTAFVMLAIPRGRTRPVRPKVLVRALFPRRLWRSASGRADLCYFVGGLLFAGLAIGWALVSAATVRDWVDAALTRLALPRASTSLATPVVAMLVTVALFLVAEFAYWLDHLLKHKVPFLWPFHKVHHQAESLSLLTNGRVHPVDTILYYNLAALLAGVAQALLGRALGPAATPALLGESNILSFLFAILLTHLQHSHLWVGFGPRWGRWLLGPAHHQIHHSADPRHFDRNLGSSLAVFDRMFGTFFPPGPHRCVTRFGVYDGEPAPHGMRAALWQPFVDSARALVPTATKAAGRAPTQPAQAEACVAAS